MATIKEVKEQLATLTDLDDHRWTSFEEDSRSGVQTERQMISHLPFLIHISASSQFMLPAYCTGI